jgi:hypothetical protein
VSYPKHNPSKKKPNTLLVVVLVLFTVVAACICGVAVATSSSDKKPSASTASSSPSAAQPVVDLGAGTPNAACATSRLGKSFVKDGVTYTCQGPEPYAWRTNAPAAPTTAAAKPAAPTISDGTWTVGEDFPAGTYKTIGAGSSCYWAIYKSGTNGSDIIDNHIGGGNLRVTLKAGQDFETARCGTWAKV